MGIVSFPNLVVSDRTVEFGCILNDMESFRKIKITNCSKVPVHYHWYFVENFTEVSERLFLKLHRTRAKPICQFEFTLYRV